MLVPIGRGSYGQVWLARSLLGAYRAVKVVSRESFDDEKSFMRELEGIRRYEPVSRTHEGLVHILHVGQSGNGSSYFYIMELADDVSGNASLNPETYVADTLAHRIKCEGRMDAHRIREIALALASALHSLHSRGLLHRDIKPSNILFVGGKPKLGDVGLVSVSGESASLVGTVGYIPPEGSGTQRADIFGLGKCMYEMLTGQDRDTFPSLPPDLHIAEGERALFARLNKVILKACSPVPKGGYPDAMALVRDLDSLSRSQTSARRRVLIPIFAAAGIAGIAAAMYRAQPTKEAGSPTGVPEGTSIQSAAPTNVRANSEVVLERRGATNAVAASVRDERFQATNGSPDSTSDVGVWVSPDAADFFKR